MKPAYRLLAAKITAVLTLAAMSAAALVWSSELVLNVVGTTLVVLQAVALFVVVNPSAGGRLFCGVFLVWSAAHTYAAADPRLLEYVPTEEWWLSACVRHHSSLGPNETPHFARIGVLITSLWLGVFTAIAAHSAMHRWRSRPTSDKPSSLRSQLQLSLRTLLVYMLLCCLAVGWLAHERARSVLIEQSLSQFQLRCQFAESNDLFPWLNALVGRSTSQEISLLICDDRELPEHLPPVRHVACDDEGANERVFASLHRLHGVRRMSVLANIDEALLTHLDEMRELEEVHFDTSPVKPSLTDVGLAHLSRVPRLKGIWHEGLIEITNSGARLLAKWPNRVRATAIDATLDEEGMRHLATALYQNDSWCGTGRQPVQLCLRNSRLDDDSLRLIASISDLHHLEFIDTDLRGKSLQPLSETGLTTLVFVRCNIDEAAVRALSPLESLRHLNIEQQRLTDTVLDSLLDFPYMCTATFSGTEISPEALERFNNASKQVEVRLAKPEDSVGEFP